MPKDKHKKGDRKKKAGKKTAQLAIRIEKAERDAFVALCEAQDTSAAREIRRFMRDYVAAHAAPAAPAPEPAAAEPPAAEAPAEAAPPSAAKPARKPRRTTAKVEAAETEVPPKAPRARRAKATA